MPRLIGVLVAFGLVLAGEALAIGVETLRIHPKGTDVALVFIHGLGGGPCSSFESEHARVVDGEKIYDCSVYEPRERKSEASPLSWFTIIDQDGEAPLPGA